MPNDISGEIAQPLWFLGKMLSINGTIPVRYRTSEMRMKMQKNGWIPFSN